MVNVLKNGVQGLWVPVLFVIGEFHGCQDLFSSGSIAGRGVGWPQSPSDGCDICILSLEMSRTIMVTWLFLGPESSLDLGELA